MAVQNISVIDRIPPQNLEAEMALLGSILVDREIMSAVSEIVAPEDFYAHVHESIYQAIVQLYDRGEPLDKITVSEELKRRNLLEKVGGLSYLSALMDTVQTAASATYYAKLVKEKSTLRGLIHAGTQISQIGFESEEDVDAALDRCEQIVYEVGSSQLRGDFVQVNRLLKPAFEQIDRLFHSRGDRTGFTTGYRDIDQMTTGLQPGNFIILAARPAMGKTSLALNMAAAAAEAEHQPVAFFSLEMTNDELVQRLICAEARLNSIDLRKGNIKPHQWEEISRAMGVLNELPIHLDDQGAITVSEIRSRCRRLKSAHGLGAVFIDYLQLVRPAMTGRNNANRNEELSEICRTLKATAKDLGVPIVALAQLNRSVESRNDKRPMLSDLRDCLAGDALVTNADTGVRVPIREIVENKLRFNVWATDERLKLVKRPIVDAWAVGDKPVLRVTTRTGRVIRCSDGHRFLTAAGWQELKNVVVGDSVAAPRRIGALTWPASAIREGQALLLGWLIGDGHLGGSATLTVATEAEAHIAAQLARDEFGLEPITKAERAGTPAMRVVLSTGRMCGAGKNPLTSWLRELGLWKKTGAQKRVPRAVFEQPAPVVAAFLRGLFHADGSMSKRPGETRATVRLSTISEGLARDVQHLLLRFGITAILKKDERHIGGYRTKTTALWTLWIGDRAAVGAFMENIGFLGAKHQRALSKFVPQKMNDAGSLDRLPLLVNERVSTLRKAHGLSHAQLGWRDQGKAMSRGTCAAVAERLEDEALSLLAYSDILWDEIVSIESDGVETVYDLTVGDLHNFCVDDLLTHNSGAIEQEADMVAFLYRDGYYNQESAEPDLTEFIISKQRNGPTGTVKLRFLKEHTIFVPYGDESHFSAP